VGVCPSGDLEALPVDWDDVFTFKYFIHKLNSIELIVALDDDDPILMSSLPSQSISGTLCYAQVIRPPATNPAAKTPATLALFGKVLDGGGAIGCDAGADIISRYLTLMGPGSPANLSRSSALRYPLRSGTVASLCGSAAGTVLGGATINSGRAGGLPLGGRSLLPSDFWGLRRFDTAALLSRYSLAL